MRRTKIVCTLGPSSSSPTVIRDLIAAGMNVARLNFSHGSHEEHAQRIKMVREEADRQGRTVAILQDLQGPKIRVGLMENGGVLVVPGQRYTLTSEPMAEGNSERAFISYDGLHEEVEVGRRILLDDGLLEFVITDVRGLDVVTEVVVGGPLRSRKGVNLPDLRSARPSLTEKDLVDLAFGLEQDVDIIALSFVRSREDVADLLRRIGGAQRTTSVVSKIEKPEAVRDIDGIIALSDGIMVARGDLGIEMPMAQVPGVQKMIIRKCMEVGKPVITATQMLESMIENSLPTRAEASDVANAVLDGTDAVMLSGETAAGKHPVRVVQMMSQIVLEAERVGFDSLKHGEAHIEGHLGSVNTTEAISLTAVNLAEQTNAAAIACLTSSGATAAAVARHRPHAPVYAFTDLPKVVRRLQLMWGTRGFAIPFQNDTDAGVRLVVSMLREHGLVQEGDRVVVTAGMPLPAKGSTNMVHITTA